MPTIEDTDEKPVALDEAFFIQALNENRESIKAHLHQKIIDGITKQFQWELPDVIKKQVTTFVEKEIAPEIQKQLIADKQLIVEAATTAVSGIALEIGKSMQLVVAKNLTDRYAVEKIAKAVFGIY